MTSSVAIATYNGEKFIAEQLNSIINQTVKPNQIVISDDNSSDNTIAIAEKILRNSGIEYIISVNNPALKILKNFDKAFSLCTGDIIFPCDQDNVWKLNFIEKFIDKFESNPDIVYAFCNGIVTDEKLKYIKPTFSDEFMNMSNENFFLNVFRSKSFPHGHTIAVKRDFVFRVIPSGFFYDEWLALCSGAVNKVGSIKDTLIYFRRHDSAATSAGKDNKRFSIRGLYSRTFDEHFSWAYHRYEAYKRFLEILSTEIKVSCIPEIKEHMLFCKCLDNIRNYNLIKREFELFKIYRSGLYEKYRGNRNSFILDALYLLHKIKS